MTAAAYLSTRAATASLQPLLLPAAILVATIPTGLAYHQPPSATLLNQCLTVALWGAVAALLTPRRIHGSTGAPALQLDGWSASPRQGA